MKISQMFNEDVKFLLIDVPVLNDLNKMITSEVKQYHKSCSNLMLYDTKIVMPHFLHIISFKGK